ncbi:MAG: Rnf-Nqr domain containing protein, partial [Planctomycetota bacterium]
GQSLGFALALASIASVREILGAGAWFGMPLLGPWWAQWGIMVLPPGAFITLGFLLGGANWLGQLGGTKTAASGN